MLHAREEKTPSGTYRPNIVLYWLGRLYRPVVAEAMRQHNHTANQAMLRWTLPSLFKDQGPPIPESSREQQK